jgi:hypothetical protein
MSLGLLQNVLEVLLNVLLFLVAILYALELKL